VVRRVLAVALAAAGLCMAQRTPNALSAKESRAGWKLLFDGHSLNGWEAHGDAAEWEAKGGAIACAATGPSWLGTTEAFSNFVLELEFRGTEKVNSGVFLRSQKEGQPHLTGYEMQIWDYQPDGYTTGSLVGSVKASPTKILGERWNRYRVTADGDHFVVVLNGKTLLDAHDAKHASGVIGFQCQKGNPIEFRAIKLMPIKK
jgi:3-keto-disaccharide hydrolase